MQKMTVFSLACVSLCCVLQADAGQIRLFFCFLFLINNFFLIEGQLLYRIFLCSVKPQPESAIGIYRMYLVLLIVFISSGYSEVRSLLWTDHGLYAFCCCCSMYSGGCEKPRVQVHPLYFDLNACSMYSGGCEKPKVEAHTLDFGLNARASFSTLPLFVPSCLYLVFAQIFFITSS